MLIDDSKKLREELLKLSPIIENKEVVLYNKDFLKLINDNVEKIYNQNLLEYKEIKQNIFKIENEIEKFNKRLSNLPILNNNFTEEDYINKIQELEREYSRKYKNINLLENKISSLNCKIKDIDYRIEVQKVEEEKLNKRKKEKLENNKKKILNDILNIKKIIELQIEKVDFKREILEEYTEIYEKKHSERYKNKIIKVNEELSQAKLKLDDLKKQHVELKDQLKNIKNILSQNLISYKKKSLQVLKLEAQKFEVINIIDENELHLEMLRRNETKSYEKLKEKINNYKISLENLIEIKSNSKDLKLKINQKEELIITLDNIKSKMKLEYEFLKIKNKLIEKKLSEFFNNKLKFILFEENDEEYTFNSKMELYYNNVLQRYLSPDEEKEVNDMILNRIKLLNSEEV